MQSQWSPDRGVQSWWEMNEWLRQDLNMSFSDSKFNTALPNTKSVDFIVSLLNLIVVDFICIDGEEDDQPRKGS